MICLFQFQRNYHKLQLLTASRVPPALRSFIDMFSVLTADYHLKSVQSIYPPFLPFSTSLTRPHTWKVEVICDVLLYNPTLNPSSNPTTHLTIVSLSCKCLTSPSTVLFLPHYTFPLSAAFYMFSQKPCPHVTSSLTHAASCHLTQLNYLADVCICDKVMQTYPVSFCESLGCTFIMPVKGMFVQLTAIRSEL